MPATKLDHIMYLSHHCSLPRGDGLVFIFTKGGQRERPSPKAALACVPSSLLCIFSLPPSCPCPHLPLFGVSLAITKVALQLWALGTKYRSNPILPSVIQKTNSDVHLTLSSLFASKNHHLSFSMLFSLSTNPSSLSLLQPLVGKIVKAFSRFNEQPG